MSAPPVPTSSRLTSSRCAASASIPSALRRTPPSQRLIRRRSRRFPDERGRVVERSVEQLDGVGLSLHRRRVPPCRRMGAVIVVAGEALIDLIVHPDGHLTAVTGGGPFNTSRTIARLGGEVAFLGRLSEDRFGQQLRRALMADGVDLSFTETTDAPTTLAVAELDDRGAATYRFHTADTSVPGLSSAADRARGRVGAGGPPRRHARPRARADRERPRPGSRGRGSRHPRDARSELPPPGHSGPRRLPGAPRAQSSDGPMSSR